jgi:hypothetical protein
MAITWTPKQFELARAEELALSSRLASSRPWIVSGLVLGVPVSGLDAEVSNGRAYIAGYVVDVDSEDVTVADDATSTVYLGLVVDGNDNVTSATLATTAHVSGYYVTLGTVTAASGDITGVATTGRSPITQEETYVKVWGEIGGTLTDQTDLDTALAGKVSTTRNVSTGTGLTGGGNLTADRTISIANGGVDTTQIANDAVTFDKTQNIATSRILGRVTASAGNIEELTTAQVLTLLGIQTPVVSTVASDQTISSGSYTDLTGLEVTGLLASSTYEITAKILLQRVSAGTNAAASFKLQRVATGRDGAVDGAWAFVPNFIFMTNGSNSPTASAVFNDSSDTHDIGITASMQNSVSTAGLLTVVFRFVTGGSGGTFKLQGALSATGGINIDVKAGSSIIATKV